MQKVAEFSACSAVTPKLKLTVRPQSRVNLIELIKAEPTLMNDFKAIESVWKNEDETFAVWPVPWPEEDEEDVWEEACMFF